MKLIETLRTYKTQLLDKLQNGDVRTKSLLSFSAVSIIAAGIWFGDIVAIEGYHPLAEVQKRVYIIATLYLLLLLKYLLVDLDTPTPSQFTDAGLRKSISVLQKRFFGALQFLRKTKINRQGKSIRLSQLPWYLLIGPKHAGKTTLLAKSNVNYILQRQFQSDDEIKPSDHCNWWVTRDTSIIDVPSRYFTESTRTEKTPILWDYYLRIVKDQRGFDAFNGIIVALPLPELMQQGNGKAYQSTLQNIFRRLHEFRSHFSGDIPCYFMITKCDLLPGFAEFFAEAGSDELGQAWGVLLPQAENTKKLGEFFTTRFNALIKKLNQQLLWRLHQERNPMARPYIKDFPLQVERLKECLQDVINRYMKEGFDFYVKGIYLTSSLQEKTDAESNIIDEPLNTTQRTIQLFKEPLPESRTYFVKQFLTHGLNNQQGLVGNKNGAGIWRNRVAYAASLLVISIVAYILGKDFNHSIQHTRTVQANIEKYTVSAKQFHNPTEHLQQTIKLMNDLRQSASTENAKFNLASLTSFYSQKSQQKSFMVYKVALQDVFLTEVRNYLGDFIKSPVNKNTDSLYGVLKAYLMLGDSSKMDKEYLKTTLKLILPDTLPENDVNQLFYHLDYALSLTKQPISLDANTIEQTRRYLLSLQGIPLAYTILKNAHNNHANSAVNLGLTNNSAFVSKQNLNTIPTMFTAHGFPKTFKKDTENAAYEALMGNWVLGDNVTITRTKEEINMLTDKLREAYIKDYINTWENILASIQLHPTKNLQQTDAIIVQMISDNSPFLQLLQTLHANTYFEPITTSSDRLLNLGQLVDRSNAPQNLLYQILVSLQGLHQYIHPVITTENQNKKAFEVVSKRMTAQGAADAVTRVRLMAQKAPEPIKSWLEKISNDTWHYLMRDATKYIDVSWQEEVAQPYKTDIANRYPFSANLDKDVDIDKFTRFFGNPGVMMSFYNYYLKPFIDTNGAEWRLKQLENEKLSLSATALLQIQQSLRIHRAFFPADDGIPAVQFTITPYNVDKEIRAVALNVNNQQIIDSGSTSKASVLLSWPVTGKYKMTTLQLFMRNGSPINRQFSGDWGWFKLIAQSFDSAVSQKQFVLNFSQDNLVAKYTVMTSKQFNPFMSMNLKNFHLPAKLIAQRNLI